MIGRRLRGTLVLVAGPSGGGKDTLMRLAEADLAGDDRFVFQKRLVTRLPSSREEHGMIAEEDFARGVPAGEFALAWRAHGNGYAIPMSALDAVREGRVVVINVSRTVIEGARQRFSAVSVVEVTASREVRQERLDNRNPTDDVASRLERGDAIPITDPDLRIFNEGDPMIHARSLVAYLRRLARP